MGGVREKKAEYFGKLKELLEEYKSIFIVGVDNVSSQQMHQVRKALRGKAVVLMGKNKDVILDNKVAAPAKAGAVAPEDIWVEAVNTGMEPGKTSFFQALGVPTKIARGTIEIVSDVKVVEAGRKVGASEAALLNLLNISPFTFGLTIVQVYDNGQTFGAEILDITDDELVGHFTAAIATITAVSLAAGYPTVPAVGHQIINNYKDLLAIAVAAEYTYPEIEELVEVLNDPTKLAALQSAAPAAAASGSTEAAAEEAEEEEAEESDDDMGFGLFD